MAFFKKNWLNCAASRLHASHTTHEVLTDTAYETTGVSELVFLIFFLCKWPVTQESGLTVDNFVKMFGVK